MEAGSAEREVKARFEASFYTVQKVTFGSLGYGPRARSVLHCHGVLALRELRKKKATSWQPAVQEGKQIEGLKLVFEGQEKVAAKASEKDS